MQESVARLAASKPKYLWWDAKALVPLMEQIEKHGGPTDVRLELWFGLNEDNEPDAWFKVVALDKDPNGDPPINYSHTCPPDCP
jgi:hypothetical protein